MKLQKIIIKNYQALEDIEINFNDSMNLIYGANATGKTSILQLIYNIFSITEMRKNMPVDYQILKDSSIIDRNKTSEFQMFFSNKKEISATRKSDSTQNISEESKYSSNTAFDSEGRGTSIRYVYDLTDSNLMKDGTIISGDTDFFYENQFNTIFFSYVSDGDDTCVSHSKHHHIFTDSFAKKYSLEMQIQRENDDREYQLPELEKFRNAIKKINPAFESIMVDYAQENTPICVIKNGIKLTMNQLSSGERSILFLLGRICLIDCAKSKNLIVLIDEIDVSLHPKWQGKIIKILKKALPHAQFIITSHSPFIWLGADKNDITHLKKDENDKTCISEIAYAEGGDLESIARKYFALEPYSKEVVRKLSEFERLLVLKDIDKAKAFIAEFEKNYGVDTPILSKLRTKLRIATK